MERVSLMGLDIDAMTEEQAVARVVDRSLNDEGGWVITPNLDHLRQFRRKPSLRRHFAEADLVLADGMPLVWASRLQDTPLPERVAGSDLIWSLTEELGRRGGSLFLVGGNPGTAEEAGGMLEQRAPGLRVVGTTCPPVGFEFDDDQMESIVTSLRDARPDVVYVGLPLDKQVAVIPHLREQLPGTWFLGLGISFSFVTGDVARAPAWMQRHGLEWIHRLVQEPKRLFRRYLLEGVPLSASLFTRSSVRGLQRRGRRRRGLPVDEAAAARPR